MLESRCGHSRTHYMFLCDHEFRENDERKGREEEKQRVWPHPAMLPPQRSISSSSPYTSSWSCLSWGSHGLSQVGGPFVGCQELDPISHIPLTTESRPVLPSAEICVPLMPSKSTGKPHLHIKKLFGFLYFSISVFIFLHKLSCAEIKTDEEINK